MKKILSGCLAGAFALTALLSAAACADGVEPGDRKAPALSDPHATLTVSGDLNASGAYDISDGIYGAFLEDINYASYAMNDNLVANGSFETYQTASANRWSSNVSTGTSNGVLAGVAEYAAKNIGNSHGVITVTESGVKIDNEGYTAVPIAVKEGVDYIFSAFIKTDKALTLTIRVTDGTTTYLEKEIPIAADGTHWIKYQRTVKATATGSENLKFEMEFTGANTTVYLDGVALETTDSTVGVKNYIYNAIKDLSPAFIRFPGGCIIEGNGALGMNGYYDWKNSVGAVVTGNNSGDDTVPAFTYLLDTDGTANTVTTYGEAVTRKHNADLWGYDMDYELGFLDYFKLCESVGASAIPVLNCGLSCQGGVPQLKGVTLAGRQNNGVNDFIQDAIDLIEFALGDSTTKWGAIRIAMGHEQPFEMHYIGIGNEQAGDYYENFYEKFLQSKPFMAALEKYHLQVIVGNDTQFYHCENPSIPGSKGVAQQAAESFLASTRNDDGTGNKVITKVGEYGVHDHHYYRNYLDFFMNHELYDGYMRGDLGYDVFVGEYSANAADTLTGESYTFDDYAWYNSWITALSEAAMMTGFERNGDVVKIAAYAPMFAPWSGNNVVLDGDRAGSVPDRQWAVDMMYFTSTQLVLSTNYYVQQLFMQNAGTYLADYKMEYASNFATTYNLTSGTASHEIDKLYYVASVDEATGDIIVKIVNASADTVKINVKLKDAKINGLAHVTVLQNDNYKAVNTLENLENPAVSPEKFSIDGFTNDTFGYEAKGYSVAAFRVHVK